jgi:hypothetical protein
VDLHVDPHRLRVNRSELMLKARMAGLPLREMWTHLVPADRFLRTGSKLAKGSGYARVCRMSEGGGQFKENGDGFLKVLASVQKHGVREAIVVYDLGDGEAEIYGGHHRAVAALLTGTKLPAVYRHLDPIWRVDKTRLDAARRAYKAVENSPDERLAAGRSYNPFPGRKCIRRSSDRLRMLYRAVIDVPGDTVLDAGCNDGYFGVALSDHGFRPTFLDRSEAYLDVVRAKLEAVGRDAVVGNMSIRDSVLDSFSVVLYTDVFYHTATKESLEAGLDDWRYLMNLTDHRMIFCPGRWDRLGRVGFTEEMLWTEAQSMGFRIRYLGRDSDPGYQRPLFCLERI